MEVEVSVSENRNLSGSSLILRNLFISVTLVDGPSGVVSSSPSHASSDLGLSRVSFKDLNLTGGKQNLSLLFQIQNKQTNTLMYVRTVPLLSILEFCRAINGLFQNWVVLYAAGDPAN